MNTVTDGCCIIDALYGIDTASPQISQFTDNFTKIKFIIGKNLEDYTVMILTDIDGQVEFVIPDGTSLVKTVNKTKNETTLLWNIGREITAQSGVIIYQIVAYKGSSENIETTWYSKEGRLKVTQSIDTSAHSSAVIGSYPDLVTKLIIEIEKTKETTNSLSQGKVDKIEGMGLSEESFTAALKEKLESIENGAQKNVCPDWNEDDSSKDSYIMNKPVLSKVASSGNYEDLKNKPEILGEYNPQSDMAMSGKAVAQAIAALIDSAPGALDTLKEISDALNNDPDFGNVVMSELLKKADISLLSKVATSGSFEDLEGKPQLSKVALSGNYADLSGEPITIISDTNFKGTDEELNRLSARGLYYFPGSSITDTLFIVVSNFEGWAYTDDGVEYKSEQWTQIIIGNQGIRKRQKINYRNFSDGRPYYTIDWQDVSTNNDLATKEDIASAIADLVDNSPETLNTLNEIAKALNNDPEFATTIINMLNEKANISDLARVATSGNYNDLIYKPKIKEINFGDIDTVWDYGVYFVDGRDGRYDEDGCAEVLIVSTALRGTGQFYFYDDGRIGYRQGQDYHWNTDFKEIISAQNPPATTSYVDNAIGDVETSLESIIAKYGLGGETI